MDLPTMIYLIEAGKTDEALDAIKKLPLEERLRWLGTWGSLKVKRTGMLAGSDVLAMMKEIEEELYSYADDLAREVEEARKLPFPQLSNEDAHLLLDNIHEIIDAAEWGSETAKDIAGCFNRYGIETREPEDDEE